MKPVTCILSDLGKVVVDYDNDKIVRRFAEFTTQPTVFIGSVIFSPKHGLHRPFEAGRMTVDGFREAVRTACELSPMLSDEDFDGIYGHALTLIPEVLTLWDRLRSKGGLTLTAVSNIDWIQWERLRRMGIPELFDHLVLSCEEGMIKPSKELMIRALDVSGAKAEETVFIDDKPENLEPAVELGIRIHQYETFKGLQIFLEAQGLGPLIYAN